VKFSQTDDPSVISDLAWYSRATYNMGLHPKFHCRT